MPNVYDIDNFVITNAPYLTISDMVDETGIPRYEIQKACDRLKITPIGKREQTKANIAFWANKKTLDEFIKMSGLGAAKIRLHCKELKITFLQSPSKKITSVPPAPIAHETPLKSTIGKRLAGVKFSSGLRNSHDYAPFRLGKDIIKKAPIR